MLKPIFLILLIVFFFKNKKLFVKSKNLKISYLGEENNDVICPENCLNQKCDNETLKCDSCVDGYYEDRCEKICPTKLCKKCDQNSGNCLECQEGYKIVSNYCCENSCIKCNEEGCLECESLEKYGPSCIDCPQTCNYIESYRKCDQETGKCNSCEKGKRGEECTENCNEGCNLEYNNCDQDNGKCDCKNGYYGDTCDQICDENCYECDKSSGICIKCKEYYYINPIDKRICNKCPENCEGTCDKQTGMCYQCKDSFYGETCNEKCSENCKDNKCEMNTGKCQCINYFSEDSNCTECKNYYDIMTNCTECIKNYDPNNFCQRCLKNYNETTNCTECNYHYNLTENCEKCELHYSSFSDCQYCEGNYDINQNCEKCINHFDIETNCEGCLVGYYGDNCDKECYEGCNTSISNCRQEDGQCEECKDLYYGNKCEIKTDVENCIKVNKNGTCEKCKDTYYLKNNLCIECSPNCTDKLCEDNTGYCYSCLDKNSYGDFCELTCSKFCNKNESEYICNRKNGRCNWGCVPTGNFLDEYCRNCQPGYYPEDEGCNKECSDNCEDKMSCNNKDGSCSGCKIGWYGNNCTDVCSDLCKRRQCTQNGVCTECIEGYFKDRNDNLCKECPLNCSTCINNTHCITCKDGNYGENKCDKKCSINCEGESCDINGNCDCKSQFFGEKCENNCKGCSENGCDDKTGNCKDHYCIDNYYDPRKCNKTCSDKCENNKCDIFTGECISCSNNNWGKECDEICSSDCKDDGRLDCCYIKNHEKSKGLEIEISFNNDNSNNFKEGQNQFSFINITLGGFDLRILVDFETNSPFVVFDSNTSVSQIETGYNIQYNRVYSSAKTNCTKGGSFDLFYEYDGFFLTKEISAQDVLVIKDNIFYNFSFLICQEFKVEKDFENTGTINGIVGLGLRNYFTENLFYNIEKKFPKNILIKNNIKEHRKTSSIYFGDYPEEIKKSFSKLSTMIIENKQSIGMDKLIEFETKFTGIAYSLRKAYHYKYDKTVKVSNRIETNIVFNNIYKYFFEKIYFGDLLGNGCHCIQGVEIEYFCEKKNKQQIQNLPKLGLILGDYIYYLSHNFLYKESESYFTFIIKLNGQGQQKIELGKSFFNEFSSIIYNNGNETLNFFGDIKKLNVPLRDPTNLLNIDSDIFTPGGWVTLIIFITVLIVIFCYLIKYCGEKTNNEEDEDDDIDYEEDSLIDDTAE